VKFLVRYRKLVDGLVKLQKLFTLVVGVKLKRLGVSTGDMFDNSKKFHYNVYAMS
jgi:hypothetical protein